MSAIFQSFTIIYNVPTKKSTAICANNAEFHTSGTSTSKTVPAHLSSQSCDAAAESCQTEACQTRQRSHANIAEQ